MQVISNDQDRKRLGRTGEEMAASYLKDKGFRILEQNYRCRLGEVDLIVEKDDSILFVEVKTRRSVEAVSPIELISRGKQLHISRVAQYYLAKKKPYEKSASFALLVVDWSGSRPSLELIEDAFPLAWGY